jgi:hypothetical protein
MKKIAVILLITIVIALAISSCNKKACPAYGKADTEQAANAG